MTLGGTNIEKQRVNNKDVKSAAEKMIIVYGTLLTVKQDSHYGAISPQYNKEM